MYAAIKQISKSKQKNRIKQVDKDSINQQKIIQKSLSNPVQSIRQLTQSRLYNFIRYFWDTYTNDDFISNWHIEVICQELEMVARRVAENQPKLYDLIINVPPGTTKTAMVSIFFPAWCWSNWYWMRFITSSHSSTLSLESAEYSRDIIRSDKFKMIFPEIDIQQDKDTKSNFRVIKKVQEYQGQAPRVMKGGGRISTSVGAKVTGFHAHIILPDDLIDPKVAISEIGLKTANRHLHQVLTMRKIDKKVTATIMIMQRLAQDDPTGNWLEKQTGRVRHICLPCEIRNYKKFLKPVEFEKYYVDDLLDPVRMPWEVLKEVEERLGQYGYSGQMGQNPVPPGGGMFKVDNFQIIDHIPSLINFVQTVRYWDKAASDGSGAYTAGVKMSKLQNGKFLIHDVRRGQWSSEVREETIKHTAENDRLEFTNYPAGRYDVNIWIEQEPGSGGKESAENTVKRLAGFLCDSESPVGNKPERADTYSVQVNWGNVMLLHGDWNHAFIKEHENFPFSTYKDQVDAAAGCFRKLTDKKQAKVWKREKN
jgi:predicted phage terminase large subunit-like protein